MLDLYSDQAREVVGLAEEESRALGHQHIGTEHLLLGILADGQTSAAATLNAAGATLGGARQKVVEAVGDRQPETVSGDLPLTARGKRVLERASRFALQRRSPEVEVEHILLALLNVDGTAGQVLRGLGVDLSKLEDAVSTDSVAPKPTPARSHRAAAKPKAVPRTKAARPAKAASARTAPSTAERNGQSPDPRCPACGAPIGDGVRSRPVPVDAEAGGPQEVVLVFCPRCGSTLGLA